LLCKKPGGRPEEGCLNHPTSNYHLTGVKETRKQEEPVREANIQLTQRRRLREEAG